MRPAFKSVGRPSKLRQTSSGQEHWGRGGAVQQQQHLICYDSGCRCQYVWWSDDLNFGVTESIIILSGLAAAIIRGVLALRPLQSIHHPAGGGAGQTLSPSGHIQHFPRPGAGVHLPCCLNTAAASCWPGAASELPYTIKIFIHAFIYGQNVTNKLVNIWHNLYYLW